MSVTIPATPYYFKAPGFGEMQFWRLNRQEAGPMFKLNGVDTVEGRLAAQVSLTFEGPDLTVTRSSYLTPNPGGGRPSRLSRAERAAYEAKAREKFLACLAGGTWVPATGV